MRSTSLFKAALIATLCFSVPVSAWAAGENWRTRASAADEITSGDIAAEVEFGRAIAARILGRYRAYDNPAFVKYVNLVGLALARNTNRPELDFHFAILDTGEVNAYAAPGGYVFVTTGALQLMKNESELAGVLAHEIAHVAEMHVVKELNIKGADDSVMSGLAQLVGGSSESARAAFSQAVDKGLDMIFKDAYKRDDELQADSTAVILCALSGYDPSALAKYLDKTRAIKEKVLVPDTDQTHPSFDTRISRINEVIAKNGIDTAKLATRQKRFSSATKGLKPAAPQNR
ncbi:MAG: M48 family metalloprotease [Nitrosomonadales bacterium]|nr:M48 family metalloprotease [Nitrosomonadales bacterium]